MASSELALLLAASADDAPADPPAEWMSWVGVVVAVLAWGSFTAPMKAAAVRRVNLHFLVFAAYQALGITASSLGQVYIYKRMRKL